MKARADKDEFTPIYRIQTIPEEDCCPHAWSPWESVPLVYPTEADALVLLGLRRTLTWSDGRVECAELFSEAGTACGRRSCPEL